MRPRRHACNHSITDLKAKREEEAAAVSGMLLPARCRLPGVEEEEEASVAAGCVYIYIYVTVIKTEKDCNIVIM